MERFLEFSEEWGAKYPAIVRLWERAWAEFVPFLQFDVEIRKIVCTTNAIESVNARIRKAVRARGHFPTEQAALKCVYLAVMSLDPTGNGAETLDQAMEAGPPSLRHRLRRPPHRDPAVTTNPRVTPLAGHTRRLSLHCVPGPDRTSHRPGPGAFQVPTSECAHDWARDRTPRWSRSATSRQGLRLLLRDPTDRRRVRAGHHAVLRRSEC